ncbi:hypothetical protein J0895_02050 [Phormidium pseudopriestleyi FRX01]|uniref:ATPase AAA-type core domain-containing protein n=1 Tax=Phormidium pseudopriestleyi FRX01 TaxID=1759528 RepID=A0ABS3FML9_9CYAN|nr:hypothetical protein [Phormidium pseudopriestleyi]MBO0347906.1 hypothetical protein [Phormidium pseudopriestleyi FRX01]
MIFIDEIDRVLSVNEFLEDFFAWIGRAIVWNLELDDLLRQGCQLLGDRSIPHSINPTLLKRCS